MAKVRAAVATGPGKVEMQEFERPKVAEDGFLLRVGQAGVCGTDRHMYLGHMKAQFPLIAGHEFMGTVEEMGSRVNETTTVIGGPLSEGDTVAIVPGSKSCGKCYYCLHVPHKPVLCPNRTVYGFTSTTRPPALYGGFAEYMYIHPWSWVFRIPDGFPVSRAVLAEPAAVTTRAIERAFGPGIPYIGEGFGIGQRAVVAGAGPIGLLCIAVLRHIGAGKVIATDLSQSRLDMAKRMGADVTINAKEVAEEDRIAQVLDLTDGVGADIVVECAGVPKVFAECLEMVRRSGKLLEVGHFTDPGPVEIRAHTICRKDVDLLGVWAYPPMQFGTALEFLAATRAPVDDLITHRFSLDQTETALQTLGAEGMLKPVVEP